MQLENLATARQTGFLRNEWRALRTVMVFNSGNGSVEIRASACPVGAFRLILLRGLSGLSTTSLLKFFCYAVLIATAQLCLIAYFYLADVKANSQPVLPSVAAHLSSAP